MFDFFFLKEMADKHDNCTHICNFRTLNGASTKEYVLSELLRKDVFVIDLTLLFFGNEGMREA